MRSKASKNVAPAARAGTALRTVASVASASAVVPSIAAARKSAWPASADDDERLFALWRRYRAVADAALAAQEVSDVSPELEQAAGFIWKDLNKIENEIATFTPITPNLLGALWVIGVGYGINKGSLYLIGAIRGMLTGIIADHVALEVDSMNERLSREFGEECRLEARGAA